MRTIQWSRFQRVAATGAALAVALTVAVTGAAGVASAAERPFVDGTETKPVYDYAKATHERVSVQVPLDVDRNGRTDRVVVDVIRPSEAADAGVDVPVIIQASPYYGKPHVPTDYDLSGVRVRYPTWLDNYFVPRGYAVAYVDLLGTHRASGCDDVGGDDEVAGAKAVVDWLNGRSKATYQNGSPAVADWTDGSTGMIGTSWNGTIANGVAATGVEGLKTIVPIAAISSWYDYTRGNGSPFYAKYVRFLNDYVSNDRSTSCVRQRTEQEKNSDSFTGSYNTWWTHRDYVRSAANVHASVYVAHGLNDENVKTRQFGQWWSALAANDVPRKLLLHQDVHKDGFLLRQRWVDEMHTWFDYWLQGLDNGVMDEPQAIVQREDGSFTTEDTWPVVGVHNAQLAFGQPWDSAAGSLTVGGSPGEGSVSVTGDGRRTTDQVTTHPTDARDGRVAFLTNKLSSDLRMSGTPRVTLRLNVDQPAAAVKVRLVDYGKATRYAGTKETGTTTCWGEQDAVDNACYADLETVTAETSHSVVTRTIADVGHHESLRHLQPLESDQWYDLSFRLNSDDVTFKAGHRLGLVLTVEDPRHEGQEFSGATVRMDLAGSRLTLPVRNEPASLQTAGAEPQVTAGDTTPEPPNTAEEMMRQFLEASK